MRGFFLHIPAPKDKSVLVVACLHPVQGFTQGQVGSVLIVQLLDLEAVGEVFKLDVGILLDGQLGVRDGLGQVGAQVLQDGFGGLQHLDAPLLHLAMVFTELQIYQQKLSFQKAIEMEISSKKVRTFPSDLN